MPDLVTLTASVDPAQMAGLEALFARFPAEMTRAAVRALNHTAGVGRTLAIKTIRAELNLKAGDIREDAHAAGGVSVDKATDNRLWSVVRITGKRLPLIRFGARPGDPAVFAGFKALLQHGVSWKIGRSGARVREGRAFIARMPSGHIGVYRRVTGVQRPGGPRPIEKRPARFAKWTDEKIAELRGPSVPHVAENSAEFARALQTDLSERLAERLAHEADYALRRITGGK